MAPVRRKKLLVAWLKAVPLLCLGAVMVLGDPFSQLVRLGSFSGATGRSMSLTSLAGLGGRSKSKPRPKRRLAIGDYTQVGNGFCDEDQPSTQALPGYENGTAAASFTDCMNLCDADGACNAFDYDTSPPAGTEPCFLFGSYDPAKLAPYPDAQCYVKTVYMVSNGLLSVSGDPTFTGLAGQAFKFDGRSGGWYANIASPSLQWNLGFRKFDACPAGQDMFVTAVGIALLDGITGQVGMDESKSILVAVEETGEGEGESESEGSSPCAGGDVCLANGSLAIVIGNERITKPGEYHFEHGIRVVAHNTFGACSRRWYDYEEEAPEETAIPGSVRGDGDDSTARRMSTTATTEEEPKTPVDLLLQSRGQMLIPSECEGWIQERSERGDLFDQRGDWATVYIETPLVGFHMELRQSEAKAESEAEFESSSPSCRYQSLDTWVSRISPTLREEQWRGITGETRRVKYDGWGDRVLNDRSAVLDYMEDEAYEVRGPFGTDFVARASPPPSAGFVRKHLPSLLQ